jgi:hypothetical protein
LLDALHLGLQKVDALVGRAFSGEFKADISLSRFWLPKLEVVASKGHVWFTLGLTSSTDYTWRAFFTREQLIALIHTIEGLPDRGRKLVETLRELM